MAFPFWFGHLQGYQDSLLIYTIFVIPPHFLPWRFVAHDLLWNIIPTPKNINSSKSDNLPSVDQYFDAFSKLQHQAVQVVSASEKSNLLEDYTLLMKVGSAKELGSITLPNFRDMLYDTIAPQIQIATNMGFSAHWKYGG